MPSECAGSGPEDQESHDNRFDATINFSRLYVIIEVIQAWTHSLIGLATAAMQEDTDKLCPGIVFSASALQTTLSIQ